MTNRNFADVVRRELANNPELAAMVVKQQKEEAEEHAELLHRYMLELDETPITGEWLERHGLPLTANGYWELPERYTAVIWGYCLPCGTSSTLCVGNKRVPGDATLGHLRTACRLTGVKMPELKEAGK